METFAGALGTVIAVYVLLRTEIGGLRGEIGGLRSEMQAGFAHVNGRIDQLIVEFARHVHEGHPPNQAA